MGEKYEIDGIVYFDEPLEVDYLEWLSKHLDCDSIVVNEIFQSDIVHIICYATTSENNERLRELRNKKYADCKILQGLSSEEVNCID